MLFILPSPSPNPNPIKSGSLTLLKVITSVICTGFMVSQLLHTQAKKIEKQRPDLRPGFTVRVHERIQEGGKERIQVFEGLIISVHKGQTPTDTTFTVRRIVSGVGVEKNFSLYSPKIEKISVKKVANVRRAKLFFLRGRRGKCARLSERFTTADEFAIATDVPEPKEDKKKEEAPAEEVKEETKEEPKEEVKEEVKEEKKEEGKKNEKKPEKDEKKEEAES